MFESWQHHYSGVAGRMEVKEFSLYVQHKICLIIIEHVFLVLKLLLIFVVFLTLRSYEEIFEIFLYTGGAVPAACIMPHSPRYVLLRGQHRSFPQRRAMT